MRTGSGRLDEHGVIWAPAAELPEVIADPQVRELGWIRDVEHREAGTYQTLGTPFHIRSAELGPRGPAPAIGQHTLEVLREFGIADDERRAARGTRRLRLIRCGVRSAARGGGACRYKALSTLGAARFEGWTRGGSPGCFG